MKTNYWQLTTIILSVCLLLVLGYESHSWLRPAKVEAQDGGSGEVTGGRFQLLQTNSKMDVLLDTATGKVWNLYGSSYLQQFPMKSCTDADCKTWKGAVDAK